MEGERLGVSVERFEIWYVNMECVDIPYDKVGCHAVLEVIWGDEKW